MNLNSDIVASYWWSFTKELRERLCYQSRIGYDKASYRWMDLTEEERSRLAPRVQLEIDAYEGFELK
jgi:hypothetical protein